MREAPGLRVVVCTPKHPDYAAGYEPFAAHEVKERRELLLDLPTATDIHPDRNRIVAFHPIGFPGRPSGLDSLVVVVDDVWAMVGGSAFRRRGLTFDGAADVVFTDTDMQDGVAHRIRDFRRMLMADRLGVPGPETTPFPAMPDARWVMLGELEDAATVVRDALIAGGLGKIERLWSGETPGVPPIPPADATLANPEGHEFPIADALATTILADLDAF
jgi:hypothetical protein